MTRAIETIKKTEAKRLIKLLADGAYDMCGSYGPKADAAREQVIDAHKKLNAIIDNQLIPVNGR